MAGCLCTVGYHENGLAFLIHFIEHGKKIGRRTGVQRSGWFVRKDQPGICDQRSCNCRPLFLSAGNLVGKFFQKLVNVKGFCNGADLLFHLLIIFACQHKGKIDVIPETEGVQKVKILEYEA